MKYEIVGSCESKTQDIAILCPKIQVHEIAKHYYDPYLKQLDRNVMVCDLYIDKSKKKTSAQQIKEYLNDLIPELQAVNIKLLIVTQPEYFKVLTKKAKTDATIGDIVDTVIPGMKATYCPNYSRIFYDPDKMKAKINSSLKTVVRWFEGDSKVTGSDIIHFEAYPDTEEDILNWLDKLYEMKCPLSCDIEGFGLKHYACGIGTITFCWNEHQGIAFCVDYEEILDNDGVTVGKRISNPKIRKALKTFFEVFQEEMVYHNICFDVYVLVYQLFMDHILDQEGMLYGLEVLLRNWQCTQLISYLATNSCAGNELSLKAQGQEYAGNYAVEAIHDITLIPKDELLKYNLIDGIVTWFVFNKNMPILIADKQEYIYKEIFTPAVKDIIQMQLTGLPINMPKVKALDKKLQGESSVLLDKMNKHQLVKTFMHEMEDELITKKNLELKTKQVSRADLGSTKSMTIEFNPNSPKQLQRLLYSEDFLGLPILDYTDTKQPATGADTLEKLINHTEDDDVKDFLTILIEFKASAIIISTFLPAFLKAKQGNDGWHYLFGNFKLGGTKSGRLSSQNPNLTNIPSSGSTKVKQRLAKLIKECVEAPPGWLFVGLDFDSLEDKISAVTTNDPMKVKVYSDGYDGHCLRALAYFPEQMPDIELCPETAKAYEAVIGDSKVYFHSEEVIEYQGNTLTGEELFNLINT